MCGIIGYTGKSEATPVLIDGLKRLEYRGYDSSGIAIKNDKVVVIKEKGRIDNLIRSVEEAKPCGSTGIGHTRWATHGVPDRINAHPHTSQNGIVTLVHNGIIENYIDLKNELIRNGYHFITHTDTEIIAQLFDCIYDGNPISTLIKVAEKLVGSYAVAMLIKDYDNTIFAMKKDSPLILGKGENENYLASDIPAILPYTKDCYMVNDNELVEMNKDKIRIFDANGIEKMIEFQRLELNADSAQKNGYKFFMEKEIFEQPKAVRDTVIPLIDKDKIILPFEFPENFTKNLKRINIVACGSAFHVGVCGKYIIEEMARIPVNVDIASEFRYRNPIIDKNDLCIFISQSGETADTLSSLREAKKRGAFTLSVVNVPFSTIARESDGVIYTNAGAEIAVATTKAFSAQLSVIYLLSAFLSHKKGYMNQVEVKKFTDEILSLPEKIQTALECNKITEELSEKICKEQNVFFIGRGIDYPLCLEGALKLKEISYIHCEGYGAGELKHGTISLIENGTVVIAVATDDRLLPKIISNIKEVRARGAYVIAVVKNGAENLRDIADRVIFVPETVPLFSPSLSAIPLQLLAYHTTVRKGLDVDKPRNLAKSVTVE